MIVKQIMQFLLACSFLKKKKKNKEKGGKKGEEKASLFSHIFFNFYYDYFILITELGHVVLHVHLLVVLVLHMVTVNVEVVYCTSSVG